ncbi:hypothetical protein HDU92_002974 [Lobulomyces angularis]|nr:hypothetical protein HDU92_002974 [Lobulomyces angularis]
MKSGSGKASQSSINRFAFKAFLYCIVFLFSWVPGTFNRASAIIDDNPMHTVYEFFLVQTIVMPLHGFMNSLIFFFFALTGNMPETSNSGSKNGYSSRDNSRSRSRSRKDEEYQNYN